MGKPFQWILGIYLHKYCEAREMYSKYFQAGQVSFIGYRYFKRCSFTYHLKFIREMVILLNGHTILCFKLLR